MTHWKSLQSNTKSTKKKPCSERETCRSKNYHFESEDDSFPSDSSGFAVTQDRQPKRTSMNLLAKESGKSRQRYKDVNGALLSASKLACDRKPNAFGYINYFKPDVTSGTDLTAIHNSSCHIPTYQAQVTFRTAHHSSKKHTNTQYPT